MKNHSSLAKMAAAFVSAAAMISSTDAQTVLSGDHVVEGNLEVGTATQKGGITIKGATGNNASPGFRVTGDGGVLFEGTSGQGSIPQTTIGKDVMMWYPGKATLKIGNSEESFWEEIGNQSVAFWNSVAAGLCSVAMISSTAYGPYSIAMTAGWTWGFYATAMSGGVADGDFSTAMSGGYALGFHSTAMGNGYAVGDYSTALGEGFAHGLRSVSIGNVQAYAYQSIVIGSYNDPIGNESVAAWVESDPLFVIGNGKDESHPHNALVIRKNGNFEMNGNVKMTAKVEMPRQGDILMGEFGNPEP